MCVCVERAVLYDCCLSESVMRHCVYRYAPVGQSPVSQVVSSWTSISVTAACRDSMLMSWSWPHPVLNPLTPTVAMGTAIKHSVSDRVKPLFVSFDIRAIRRSPLSVRVPGCQKLQTRSGTGCFIAVPIWQ